MSFLFGSNGGLTHKKLQSMTQRSKFSEYLPWVAYDDETRVYLNIDNTIGFIWECSPLCFAGEKTAAILQGLFRVGFPEGSVIQCILYADENIDSFIKQYKDVQVRKNPIVQNTTEKFSRFLLGGVKGLNNLSGIPIRNFRLFVTVKMPLDDTKRINIEDIHGTVEEILRGANLYPKPLEPGGLLDWMRRFLNDGPSENNGNYDDNVPIRKQAILSDSIVRKKLSTLEVGEKIFRCTTPKCFPKEVDLLQTNELIGGIQGIISDTDQLRTPFMYTVNIVMQNLKSKLHAKCNMVLQQQGVGSFAPSLMRKKEEYLWAVDELEKGTKFLRIIPVFWIWGNNHKIVTESITRVKRVWESLGYIMQEDKGILPILFISSLPFGLYNKGKNIDNLDRDFIAPADTVSTLLPVQSDFSGTGKPILVFSGRKGQICGLDVFDPAASNHNIFIAAGSGNGKSFLVNYIVYNYYASNALIRLIDLGGSYKKLTKMFNGRFIDFSEKTDMCLNPFSNVIEVKHDLSVIASIIAQMIYSTSSNPRLSETEMTIIKNAVRWAYHTEGSDADIDTVHAYLNSFPKHATDLNFDCEDKEQCTEDITKIAQTLSYNIQEFTSNGIYGRYFNGKSTFDISSDEFVVLELENLKHQKELFNVVTLQIINAVTQDLYLSDRSRARLNIFEEASQFMKEGAILKEVIEEGYRRARKYGGSFTVVTQSVLDRKAFGSVGDVISSNSAFKFFLESEDFEKARAEKLVDYDEFKMNLLKSVKTNKPRYSEIFMDTPFGTGVARLVVDPFSYYVYTSDAKEISEIEALVDGGMSYDQAIREMVRKYRS